MILFPQAASTIAPRVDRLTLALLAMSAVIALGVATAIVYLCVKYREGSPADRSPSSPFWQAVVEATWITVPTLIGLGFFAWGGAVYVREKRPPPDSLEIRVIGKQWMWHLQHPGGQREINELHIPIHRPVRLAMTSQDVIHSFYVPEFRVKQDVLPDRVTSVWFEAAREGVYQIECAQYCGTEHARMRGRVIALKPRDYARWLAGEKLEPPLSAAGRGAALFEREACATCHLRAGGKAPPLDRVAGRAVRLSDDSVVVADDSYLRESIVNPGAKIVYGYPNIMPSFNGRLSEEQIDDILEYLHSIGRGEEVGP